MVAGACGAPVALVSARLGFVRHRNALCIRGQYHAGALSGAESRATETGVRILEFSKNSIYRINIVH